MNIFKFIFRSITYYWKSHLAVVSGIAICTMVLTGTLFVGDSIRASLETSTLLRLGKTEFLFSGPDRYFRTGLTKEISTDLKANIAPILQLDGIASSQGGKYKLNDIQVIGIDNKFTSFIPGDVNSFLPGKNEAYISVNMAQRLQVREGESLLLRIEKASQIPKNAPFVSDAENYVSLRLKVGKIINENELGRFNLKTSQTAPFNVFLSLPFLNSKLEWSQKANRILFSGGENINQNTIVEAIARNWKLEDMALDLFRVNEGLQWEIRSKRIFMDSIIVNAIRKVDPESRPILTYMVNSFRYGTLETPYSFISAGPFNNEIPEPKQGMIINDWLASDLNTSVGDSIEIAYYEIGPLRKLSLAKKWFTVTRIEPIEGIYADEELMPNLPGLSDAGNCREWEAGVPVILDKIRDKDEDYWKRYKGTPKAFISYNDGENLWKNRFGQCTAIRLSENNLSRDTLEHKIPDLISPINLGYKVTPVLRDGLTAAKGGVDFSQLFMGLSFFLLAAGMILLALLYNLHLEKRFSETGTLKAMGYSNRLIHRLILFEGIIIAIPGVIIGGILAILYNKLIFYALNTVWYDIVLTTILREVIQPETLLMGMLIALVLVIATIWYNVSNRLKISSSDLQRKIVKKVKRKTTRFFMLGGNIAFVISMALLIYDLLSGNALNTTIFFSAGTLLLLSLLLYISYILRTRPSNPDRQITYYSIILKNLYRNISRSLRIIILFSLGTFVVISTGLNRKDLHGSANLPSSGTGGFLFYMETTLPVLHDLNDPRIKQNAGIEESFSFIQIRKNEGDDASCLNLNRVTAPRILGIPSTGLKDRFSFIKNTSDLDENNPWISLKTKLPGNVIPAIADQTVIQWGLGKQVGDTLFYIDEQGQELNIKLIGGLTNSIFQGNVLIDEDLFLEHFPSSSGSNVFLINDSNKEGNDAFESLQRLFRNEGPDIQIAADRLAAFNQVENTYLSIFMILGGLAMILGTVGLGISLARNILNRRQEIGILAAIGIQKRKILNMITTEHLLLLVAGTLAGTISAYIATLPSIISTNLQTSWLTGLVIVLTILINGFVWIVIITRRSLRQKLLENLRTE